jgi:PhnB protein
MTAHLNYICLTDKFDFKILKRANTRNVRHHRIAKPRTQAFGIRNEKTTFKIKIMALINPHINFNGNAEEAFNFYKSVFGGEFAKIIRLKDISSPEFPVAENDANKIMHIALPIGKNSLMANDVPESMGQVNENENRSKISISAESREEADKLFVGLSAGGSVEVPIGESPWGSYFAMFRDKFGIEWMVDFDPKNNGKI